MKAPAEEKKTKEVAEALASAGLETYTRSTDGAAMPYILTSQTGSRQSRTHRLSVSYCVRSPSVSLIAASVSGRPQCSARLLVSLLPHCPLRHHGA
jgi:hypothetical protein